MDGVDVVGSIVKVVLIFGLLWLTLRFVGRLNGAPRGPVVGRRRAAAPRPVEVIGRSPLGRTSSVAVVRLGDRCFALGVTEQQVRLLTEVEVDLTAPEPSGTAGLPEAFPPIPAGTQVPGSRPSWRDLVETLRERTVRH